MINEILDPLTGVEVEARGSLLRVLDQGAQVVHWRPAGESPVLFGSAAAAYVPGRHVRAGAPLVYPWFGNGPCSDLAPVHGYGRLRTFRRRRCEAEDGAAVVSHVLEPEEPADLPARLEVTTTAMAETLEIALMVVNLSDAPISYEVGLHTYFLVDDLTRVSLAGLGGSEYLDRATSEWAVQTDRELVIRGEVDRVYRHSGAVVLNDPGFGRRIEIDKDGSSTTIVWNPGEEKTKGFADFGDDEWQRTVCVEAARMGDDAVRLAPGDRHRLLQRLRLLD